SHATTQSYALSLHDALPIYSEFCRACLRASEADAAPGPSGVMIPAAMPLWTVRMMYARMFVRMCEIIQILGAGGLVAVPSYAELDRKSTRLNSSHDQISYAV